MALEVFYLVMPLMKASAKKSLEIMAADMSGLCFIH